jgi:hypothetical protein
MSLQTDILPLHHEAIQGKTEDKESQQPGNRNVQRFFA